LDASIQVKRKNISVEDLKQAEIRKGKGRPNKNPGEDTVYIFPNISESKFAPKSFDLTSQDHFSQSEVDDMEYCSPIKPHGEMGTLDIDLSNLSQMYDNFRGYDEKKKERNKGK